MLRLLSATAILPGVSGVGSSRNGSGTSFRNSFKYDDKKNHVWLPSALSLPCCKFSASAGWKTSIAATRSGVKKLVLQSDVREVQEGGNDTSSGTLRVALICGGPSAERGISLNSARSVLDHLQAEDVLVSCYYLNQKLEFFSIPSAQMYSNTPSDFDFKIASFRSHAEFLEHLQETSVIVFPVLHGQFGEGEGIQALLESAGLPFVGTGAAAARVAFDKDGKVDINGLRKWFQNNNIDTNTGRVVVKPARSGSSFERDVLRDILGSRRSCECHDWYDEQVPYVDAWRWQKLCVEEKVARLAGGEDFDDTVIVLQHPPVYTLGTRSSEANLKFDAEHPPFELHRTERGGEVTYHGPGQLVVYPILNLRHHNMDLHWYLRTLEEVVIGALDKACGHWYLRTLEEVVIGALDKACGIPAHRIDGLTGVWVDNQKVAAIGVRVSRWITYHGLALNVTTDLSPFSNIIPCGISDYSVTSVAKLLENSCESNQVNVGSLLKLLHDCLLEEFATKFNLHLIPPTLP